MKGSELGHRGRMIRERIDALVCDLDGVVYRADQVIGGAPEAVDLLRELGIRLVFATNNSRLTPQQYKAKLASLGLKVEEGEILTSAMVTAEVLRARGYAGGRAIVVGGEGVRTALESVGIEVADDPGDISAALVVVGWDPDFHYSAMRRAALAVEAGAGLIATNDDAAFPAPDGALWPGAGAILASIEVASGSKAEVMGKPNRPMMDALARRLDGARCVVVLGDRAETDLAGGAAMGWGTVLALSGVTARDDVPELTPAPDLVVDDLLEFARLLRQ